MCRTFLFRCVVVFFEALVADIIAAVHIKTLVDNAITLAVATVVILHLLSFFSSHWFTDYKTARNRFGITAMSALGAGLGTLIVCSCP